MKTFSQLLLSICVLILSVSSIGKANPSFSDDEFQRLLNQPSRPTMAQIVELLTQNQVPTLFLENQSYDTQFIKLAEKIGPDVIAQFEKIFPGMNYAALGRDAVLLGDMLDAYYQSIGQMDRIYRINASGASLTGNPDDLVDFVKHQTKFDSKKSEEYPGLVIFDSTRWEDHSKHTSQSKLFMDAVYKACLAHPDCHPDMLLEKFNFLNVGAQRPDMYKRNIYSSNFNLYNFHVDLVEDLIKGNSPTKIMSLSIPLKFIYSDPFHDTFQKLTRYPDGQIYALPGKLKDESERRSVIRTQIALYHSVTNHYFNEKVLLHAQQYNYVFPQRRVTDLHERWEIRAKKNPPPSIKKIAFERKIRMAATGLLMTLGVIGGGVGYHEYDLQHQEQARIEKIQHNEAEVQTLKQMESEINQAATYQEVVKVLTPRVHFPSQEYIHKIQAIWKSHINEILRMQPSFDEIKAIKSNFSDIELLETVTIYQLDHLDRNEHFHQQFLQALVHSSGMAKIDADQALIAKLMTSSRLKSFFELGNKSPSIQDTLGLLKLLSDPQQKMEVLNAGAEFYKGFDLISLLKSSGSKLSPQQHQTLFDLWKSHAFDIAKESLTQSKQPKTKALSQIKNEINSIEFVFAFMDGLLEKSQSLEEFLAIIDPGGVAASDKYFNAIEKVINNHIPKLETLVITSADMKLVKSKIRNITLIVTVIEKRLLETQSIAEFEDLLTPPSSNFSEKYSQELNRFYLKYADHFIQLQPTIAQINKAKLKDATVDGAVVLMEKGMSQVKTASDFTYLLNPQVGVLSDKYKEAIDQLHIKHANHFVTLKPSREEIRTEIRLTNSIASAMAVREALLLNTNSLGDFEFILNPFHSSPNQAYLTELGKQYGKFAQKYLSLHPSASQINKAKLTDGSIEGVTALLTAYIQSDFLTVDGFAQVINPQISNPNSNYLKALKELYRQGVEVFAKKQLSPQEIVRLKKVALDPEALMHFNKFFGDSKSNGNPGPPPSYLQKVSSTRLTPKACILSLDNIHEL